MSKFQKTAAAGTLISVVVVLGLAFRLSTTAVSPGAATKELPARPAASRARAMPVRDRPMIEARVPKQPPRVHQRSTYAVSAPPNEPDRVVAELKPAASAGNPTAMRMLGETLDRCAHADMRSDSELEAAAAKKSLDMEFMAKKGIVTVMEGETDATKAAARMAASMKQIRDSCAKIADQDRDAAHDWLLKAAEAGDPEARLPLASDVIKRSKDPNLLIEQRERLDAEWTQLLEANIADGACTNMELNLFWQNSRDPILVYIYAGILMRRGLAAIDSLPPETREQEREALNRNLKVYAAAVPEDQLRAAEATRDYIEANYCSNFP